MTYYASVTVTQDFASRDEAEAFVAKVLESTKGADFEKSIKYRKNRNYGGMGPSYINNPVTEPASSVSQKIVRAAQLGLLRDGE